MKIGDLDVKQRDVLYRLIVSQLIYDGHTDLAVTCQKVLRPLHPAPACPPSDRLLHIVKMGIKCEEDSLESRQLNAEVVTPGSGIDLEYETEVQTISAEAALYETCYVTAHKGPCRAASFHPSGQLIATGSDDASIKILDVERMLAKSATPAEIIAMETPQQQMENHPVIRTLYDHVGEVTCLDFHPFHQILVSGGSDFSIRFFEYSKPSVKKAYKSIQEAAAVTCLSFHPGGDYILTGTEHSTLRLYDVNTFQCFVSSDPKDQHKGPLTDVNWSPNAKLFVTCSRDGSMKIWDGVSQKCISTLIDAHKGEELCSAVFSRNSKYILSSGKDSLVRLWELSTNRCLIVYTVYCVCVVNFSTFCQVVKILWFVSGSCRPIGV
ncbi:cleavage stimulation factor subunit 1-like isoform X2 [Gigantopelta aegis]|uniref:cleavage stimulation factor subunit 1-like isoform X2 n=1 Tax=Gigantopelta aegis TaxID=1735272 RepID=UPI001B888B28|nr:cleavage stimulation factor subunit 1-like isoform X2 [Gigantopelta aegis]